MGARAFCGNGARAAFTWWRTLTEEQFNDARFTAVDGAHEGHWVQDEPCVDLHVQDGPKDTPHGAFVHTGTEHLVVGMSTEHLLDLNLVELAHPIRHHEDFAPLGSTSTSWPLPRTPMADSHCGPSKRGWRPRP